MESLGSLLGWLEDNDPVSAWLEDEFDVVSLPVDKLHVIEPEVELDLPRLIGVVLGKEEALARVVVLDIVERVVALSGKLHLLELTLKQLALDDISVEQVIILLWCWLWLRLWSWLWLWLWRWLWLLWCWGWLWSRCWSWSWSWGRVLWISSELREGNKVVVVSLSINNNLLLTSWDLQLVSIVQCDLLWEDDLSTIQVSKFKLLLEYVLRIILGIDEAKSSTEFIPAALNSSVVSIVLVTLKELLDILRVCVVSGDVKHSP